MRISVIAATAGAVLFGLAATGAEAAQMYDMRLFLNQSHPFARNTQPAPPAYQPAAPAAVTASPTTAQGQGVPTVPASSPAPMTPEEEGLYGILSEIRAGVFWHDIGPFGSHKEEGYDGNLEVLFVSPDFMEAVWSPRPHLGVTVNNSGNTSQAYFGLTWEWDIWEGIFGGVSWGGSVHNGKTRTMELDRKELGCRLLFRESFYLGYRINEHHNLQLHLDHISNAKLCDTNEGLDNFGVRYGYRF
jgi:lipid A 3-O-deacylase